MIKQIYIGLSALLLSTSALANQELACALSDTPAPAQEFIRTPAKYIYPKIINAAQRSGNPVLSTFDIKPALQGCADVKVTINLENKTLLDVVLEMANSTGAGVDFQERVVVFKDPSEVEAFVLEEAKAEEPEVLATSNEETQEEKSKPSKGPQYSFRDISHALVFVENGGGRGSAFIAEMDGKTYVFSNQHNFLGAKRIVMRAMNGSILKPKSFEYSRTHDLVRMLLEPADIEGLGILQLAPEIPSIDDEITIYGNSAGGGVATQLDGDIIGVGPNDIEISAKMVPGNSGSPIINHNAEVVGVATYATLGASFEQGSSYDKMFKGTRFSKVRRYGVRIPDEGWISDSLNFYLRQTYRQEDIKTYVMAVYALYRYWQGDSNYESFAKRLFDSYGSIKEDKHPPIEFKIKENEERMRRVVRSLKINHSDMHRKMDEGKKINTFEIEDSVSRIKNILSSGVEEMLLVVEDTRWKTNLLKRNAQELRDISEDLINQIEEAKSPYKQNSSRRR